VDEPVVNKESKGFVQLSKSDSEFKEAGFSFRESLTNRLSKFFFEITNIVKVNNPRIEIYESTRKSLKEQGLSQKELEDRWVFHTNSDLEISQKIASTNLRPSNCQTCKAGNKCADPGFFGDHTKGVYVSKHADYTFYYQKGHKAEVEENDIGAVIMMKMFTGKIKHLDKLAVKEPPTLGYHCHETTNFMEYYVWDTNQIMPYYIISWKAISNTRMIKEEGVDEKKGTGSCHYYE